MRLSTKKIIIMSSIALIVMSIVFITTETYGEDQITMQKLSGIWWTYDADDVPWAIQFNKDGTYTINLILISAGSVIESLKINNQVEGISYATPSGSSPADSTRASALATFIDLATNPRTQGVENVATKKFLTSEEQNQLNLSIY